MAQADDIQRLTEIVVRLFQGGRARELRRAAYGPGDAGLGFVAKASGATPDQVRLWETGELMPPTNQALTWLKALHDAQPTSVEQGRRQRRAAHAADQAALADQAARRAGVPVDGRNGQEVSR